MSVLDPTLSLSERVSVALGESFLVLSMMGEPLSDRQKNVFREITLSAIEEGEGEPAGQLIPGDHPGERIDEEGQRWYSSDWLSSRIEQAVSAEAWRFIFSGDAA